jgi:hypothetical protein
MAAIKEDVEVNEGLVPVARRLRKWRKVRGEEWANERATQEAEAEAKRAEEREEAARKVAEEMEAAAEEEARVSVKRARLARARIVIESDDDDEDNMVATRDTPAATPTTAVTAARAKEAASVDDVPTMTGADKTRRPADEREGHRTVWGVDAVTPAVFRPYVEARPALEHLFGGRMTVSKARETHTEVGRERIRRGRSGGRVPIAIRAARQPGDKVSEF